MSYETTRFVDLRRRWTILSLLLVGVLGGALLMAPSEQTMRAQGNEDYGILTLETAGPDRARAILATWGDAGIQAARHQIALDYLWLLLYAGALALACVMVGAALGQAWERVGVVISYAALLAGVLDAVENTALLALLDGRDPTLTTRVARACAYPKFVLIFLALLFSSVGLMTFLVRRFREREAASAPPSAGRSR